MSTFTDIRKAAIGPVSTSVDSVTPAGHFLATTNILGIVTTYLLEGSEGDVSAPIKGRVEMVDRRKQNAPNYLNSYRGDGIKGGGFLPFHTYGESFTAMV